MHNKIVEIERVIVKHDSACVTDNLKNEAADHADHEPPSLISNAKRDLGNKQQTKDGGIKGIASKCWKVFNLSAAKGTCSHSAVGIA